MTKPIYFRVSGLSPGTAADVESYLTGQLQNRLSDSEKGLQYTIHKVRACYSTKDSPSSVAIIGFDKGTPEFLVPLMLEPLDEITIEDTSREGRKSKFTIDRHFHGFTQLYETDPKHEVTADVIAITGLDANAYGSWMTRADGNTMWLKDFLAEDMPHCRTMIYGYQSKLKKPHTNLLLEFGRELFGEIKKIRTTKEDQRRPIIFIAHSYGGLLLTHCIVRAFRSSDDIRDSLYKSTYGMLFFGTPHHGSVKTALLNMVPDIDNPRRSLLHETEPESDVLRIQVTDFKNIIGDRKIASFYETEPTPTPQMGPDGDWARTGRLTLQVTEASALLQLPDTMEAKFPVNANHSNMVKFKSRNDTTYTTVLGLLRDFEREAARTVEQRYEISITSPTPHFMVPYGLNDDFVCHPEIAEQLGKIFNTEHTQRRAAVIGLGGIGKTSIAVQFAYTYKKMFPHSWVFWIRASTATRFKQGYLEIAKALDLPGRDDPTTDVVNLVSAHLAEAKFKWLMILESADDMAVVPARQLNSEISESESPFLAAAPYCPNGSVLITSRDRNTARQLVGESGTIIPVPLLSDEKAVELLRIRSQDFESPEADAQTLVSQLERIPLAITQASAYIADNARISSITRYLELFQESKSNQATLLGKNTQIHGGCANSSILTTWAISFEQVRNNHPNAATLFSIMSFLDSKAIPDSLFTKNMPEYINYSLAFEDEVAPLISLSLISPELGGSSFDMHRLLQFAQREWLETHGEAEKYRSAAMKLVLKALPEAAKQFENWMLCKKIIPHAEALLQYLPETSDEELSSGHASLLFKTAYHAFLKGDHKTAFDKSIMAKETYTRFLDTGDLRVIEVTDLISKIVLGMDKGWSRSDAIGFQEAALERRAAYYGPSHIKSRASLHIIASISKLLVEEGRLEEAEAMANKALLGLQSYNKPAGPGALMAMRTLAFVYQARRQFRESEKIFRDIKSLQEEHRGPENFDSIVSARDLADLYTSYHRYDAAVPLYRKGQQCLEKAFGSEHHMTKDFSARLAVTVARSKQWRWLMPRMTASALQIPFKLGLGVKHRFTALFSMAKAKIKDLVDQNLSRVDGVLYIRVRVFTHALFFVIGCGSFYIGITEGYPIQNASVLDLLNVHHGF